MAEHVISHREPRRKRGGRRLALRRLGTLAVTVAALATASWLAPRFYRPPPAPPPAQVVEAPAPPVKRPPDPEHIKVFTIAAAPFERPPRPRRARRSAVPLDARPAGLGEDFEVLSADELDAISQARN